MDEIVNRSKRREVALTNDGAGSILPQPANITKAKT